MTICSEISLLNNLNKIKQLIFINLQWFDCIYIFFSTNYKLLQSIREQFICYNFFLMLPSSKIHLRFFHVQLDDIF